MGNTLVNNDGTLKNSRQTVKKKHKRKIGLKNIETYALLLPAMTLLFVFHYIPIYGILIAFKDFNPYQGMFGGKWVGLKYFKMFLTNDYFWKVVRIH